MRNKKYVERLAKEWLEHGKIILAVDYDSTIFPWHTIDNQEDMDRVINLVQQAHEIGAYVVINTCSNKDRHPEIIDYCKKINLPVDGINTQPIQLPYGHFGKIYANIYLDDRAGLLEALDILERAMYHVKGIRITQNLIM